MLVQKFDFLVAEYNRIESVDKSEAEQADAIVVRGYVPGGIYHAAQMSWRGNFVGFENPVDFIRSKKERGTVNRSKRYFTDQGYSFRVQPMTEDLYLQFASLYEETTMDRDRAVRYKIEKVLEDIRDGVPRYVVGMFEKDKLQSALLFSVRDGSAFVSFGAKQKFDKTRGGVGGVLEMELLDYCFTNGINEVSHGQSMNPAGITGSSGIFEFKTRYGYTAYPKDYWQTMFIKNRKVAMSDLVFVTTIDDRLGYLVVTDSKNLSQVVSKYKTKEIDTIEVVQFTEVFGGYQRFLNSLP